MSKSEKSQLNNDDSGSKIGDAIINFISKIPRTKELKSLSPSDRARSIANVAAAKAATVAGSLALPPGPLNWITILPELIAVWKIQSQMVADLAGAYGKTDYLSESQMLYCLFRHGAAMAVRDIVVRVGDRYLIRRATQRMLQDAAKRIGIRITQKAAAKAVGRWIPIIGAVGVGGYAFYDTAQVAKTAIELFESELEFESDSNNLCDRS
jgi:hypothetical protein